MGSSVGENDPEREVKLKAYMFQRRVLAVTTLMLGVAVILWIVCMSSSSWFNIVGSETSYIPEKRRYFKSSHMGLWRSCRYTLHAVVVPNVPSVRNFTTLGVANITQRKLKHSKEEFVQRFLSEEISNPQTYEEIDDNFLRHLFAHWLKDDDEFQELRRKYKKLSAGKFNFVYPDKPIEIPPTDLKKVNETIRDSVSSLKIDDTQVNVVIPKQVRALIFKEFYENTRLSGVIPAFVKDMGVPCSLFGDDGKMYSLKVPLPKMFKNDENYKYNSIKACEYHDFFQSEEDTKSNKERDDMLDFIRTSASFAIMGTFIMIMGFFFSSYTFLNPRYMFKRLAGGIHFISAATIIVSIQTLHESINFAEAHDRFTIPDGATSSKGYAYYLAWFVFAFNVFAFLTFMWYSKKKKGAKAFTDELGMADEEINIGR